ncbi:MAG TPA: hypothetical protein PLL09_05780 [Flavobacterium sp.]|uniref:hypothetical protein n=1 Tax=unclassified Flavobacterium TaxID=196869 RepID=UPI000E85255F|nr:MULTISPECIES: hypothetical protein [unclassified Flavobacterium]HBI00646.1 hypothetical protein [Flavobacterium sp.]HRE77318.1 hypothetical protein [Flavobacterium sp.]
MRRTKIYKILALLVLFTNVGGVIWYTQLSTRHKAIVKTTLLHKTGLVDNDWQVENSSKEYKMLSPTFIVDDIYKSMEGPKASNYVMLSQDSTLLWITGFKVIAQDAKTGEKMSNDFICHMNVDMNDSKYYSNFGLENRIGKQYPRLTSLSHGMETFEFPEGYGVPMKGNDLLFVTTQTLNHNIKDAYYKVKHKVSITYEDDKNIKPLMSKTAFIMLPYDKYDPYKSPIDPGADFCIPVETKNHSYNDGSGNKLSGHWVIPIGKNTYRSGINHQLETKDSLRLHAAAIHVHPFATRIMLFNKTTQKPVFVSEVTNHKNSIGLTNIENFTSKEGIWLYENQEYEIVLEVNNTSKEEQDMMGSMFLFFYDEEMDLIVNSKFK